MCTCDRFTVPLLLGGLIFCRYYINTVKKYLTSQRDFDISCAWKKWIHENSARMRNNSFATKSFDFVNRVENITRSVKLLVLAVAPAALGGLFTKKEVKKPFKLKSEAASLEATAL